MHSAGLKQWSGSDMIAQSATRALAIKTFENCTASVAGVTLKVFVFLL